MIILEGLAATGLAAVVVASWIAVGSIFVKWTSDEPATVPAAILIGSGISSFMLVLVSLTGALLPGVVFVELALVGLLVLRWRTVMSLIRAQWLGLRELLQGRAAAVALLVVGAVVWLSAISPPRNADAMRYHLAHIRQIVADGRWIPIRDFHYALPFGWTMNFLPFEMARIPQGAQLLSVFLLVVILSSVLRAIRKEGGGVVAALIGAAILLHPFVLRTFVDPTADAYSLLIVCAISLVVMREDRGGLRDAAVAGFVIWIGMQSRYQIAAIAIPASAIWMWTLYRSGKSGATGRSGSPLAWWLAGAGVALLLASPFYIANYLEFQNPVWPLLISAAAQAADYASNVAGEYARSLSGDHTSADFAFGLRRLATTETVFPIPYLVVAAAAASFFSKRWKVRRLGFLVAGFLIMWLGMQPRLYPRFVILLVPLVALIAGIGVAEWGRNRNMPRWLPPLATTIIAMLAAAACLVSWDNIRYVATGNVSDYHRFTWFYPTYQWVNRNTPRDARFLVIVSSGHSYYLDRRYRRADPWLSGVVDWSRTADGEALKQVLGSGKYSYVIYQDRDWSAFPGGRHVMTAIRSAIHSGYLEPVHTATEKLYSSRVKRLYTTTNVIVLKVNSSVPTS